MIRETAICVYSLVIHTPKLCSDPVFLDSAPDRSTTPATEISCKPVLNQIPDSLPPSPATEPIPPSPQPVPVTAETQASSRAAEGDERAGRLVASKQDTVAHGYEDGVEPEMVTVIYDEDTGDIKQAFTDDGEDITHEFEGYDESHHDHHHHHDHAHNHDDTDHARIVDLQDLAKDMQRKIAAALTEAGIAGNFDGHDGHPRAGLVDAEGRELPPYEVRKLTGRQLEDLLASVAGEMGAEVVVELAGVAGAGEEMEEARSVAAPRREETEEDREQARNRNAFKRMYEGAPVGAQGEGGERRRDEL